jgi:hypothetical protein
MFLRPISEIGRIAEENSPKVRFLSSESALRTMEGSVEPEHSKTWSAVARHSPPLLAQDTCDNQRTSLQISNLNLSLSTFVRMRRRKLAKSVLP